MLLIWCSLTVRRVRQSALSFWSVLRAQKPYTAFFHTSQCELCLAQKYSVIWNTPKEKGTVVSESIQELLCELGWCPPANICHQKICYWNFLHKILQVEYLYDFNPDLFVFTLFYILVTLYHGKMWLFLLIKFPKFQKKIHQKSHLDQI